MGRPDSNTIANILRKHQIRVFRAETSIADKARQRVVSGVRVGLVRLLNDGDPTGVKRTPYRRDRVEAVAAAGRTQLRREFASIDRSIDRELEDMGELDGQVIARAINAVDGDLAVSVLSPKQLHDAVESAVIDGAPSGDWWKQQADEITQRFRREMLAGTEAGESVGQLIDRVRGFAPTREGVGGILTKRKLADIEALVRTSTQTTLNEIRHRDFQKNADVIRGLAWLSTFDKRVCPQCAALSGSAWEMAGLSRTPPVFKALSGSPYRGKLPVKHPPLHWNCLPGDALVSAVGGIAAKSRRRYEGDLVVLRTAGGRELPCTPNHPVLTDRGWLPAHLVNVGCHIVGSRFSERRDWREHPDSQNVPAGIEDVAVAALGARGVLSEEVPVTPEDFHGDGRGSNVAVVSANRLLRDHASHAALLQHANQLEFGRGLPKRFAFARHRQLLARILGRGPAAHGRMGGGAQALPLFGRCPGHAQQHRGAAVARRDPGVYQAATYQHARDAKGFRDRLFRLAGKVALDDLLRGYVSPPSRPALHAGLVQPGVDDIAGDAHLAREIMAGAAGKVTLDQVIHVDVQSFHGDVFNLETSSNSFVANGVVTHNCRCLLSVVLDDEDLPDDLEADDWIRSQPLPVQIDILGKGVHEIWQSGVPLVDMLNDRGSMMSVAELRREFEREAKAA